MKFTTNRFQISVEQNRISDEGEGVIKFTKPVVITDNTEQRNGTRYDIQSMDISEYDNGITADHSMSIQEVIGQTFGVMKGKSKVTIDGIKFAVKESALASFAYNMMKGGFLKNFSIETFGPYPDEDGVYHESKLVGLSLVTLGNNRSASINQLAMNSLAQAKELGLDTENIERIISDNNLNPSQQHMEPKDEPKKDDKKVVDPTPTPTPTPTQEPTVPEENALLKQVMNAISGIEKKVDAIEQKQFNNSAEEPKFVPADTAKVMKQLQGMSWMQRHGKQIQYAWDFLKSNNAEAGRKLEDINKLHVEKLQEAGKVDNSVTIADFGNFVISPELLTKIEGFRSDFSSLISRLNFQETLSLQMAFLKRDGDINMQEVEMCDDGADGNLKPISEYDAEIHTSNLHELAAVTPVCNAATRFLAADMLGDIAQGYRTDFDRKRAQLFIARAQQAVNATGNTTVYNTTTDVNALKAWISMWGSMNEEIMNGVFIFNQKTYAQLLSRAVGAGISGPLSSLFTTGDQPTILGNPFIVVPNELMPTLNSNETKSFVVEGVTVTINQAIFYVDLNTFSGRTSGGLSYDLSTDAAYEVGSDVRSAFQRNELVLRGSFFRGGVIRDEDKVVGMGTAGVS